MAKTNGNCRFLDGRLSTLDGRLSTYFMNIVLGLMGESAPDVAEIFTVFFYQTNSLNTYLILFSLLYT